MKLIYFNYLAYAEPIKMMMNHGNIPFEFIFPWDYFGAGKFLESKIYPSLNHKSLFLVMMKSSSNYFININYKKL